MTNESPNKIERRELLTNLGAVAAGIALVTPDPCAEGAPLSILFDLGGAAAAMMLIACFSTTRIPHVHVVPAEGETEVSHP